MERCSFCGCEIERGTGKISVQKDSSLLYFCSKKCEKNMLKLRRSPIKVKWTRAYRKRKGKLKPGEDVITSAPAKKPKKGKMPVFVEVGKEPEAEKKEEKKEAPKEEKKEEKEEPKEEKKEEAPKEEKKETKK